MQMMMFETRVFLGGADVDDRYKDLRLDVDNMTYEVFTIPSHGIYRPIYAIS